MPEYYEFEVSLRHATPRIWRRFLISKKANFLKLHEAIQDACGWDHSHLLAFREWGRQGREFAGTPADVFMAPWEQPTPDASKVKLADFFEQPGHARCVYLYDFGDGWEHEVKRRKRVSCPESFKRRLIAGERAFPPEDCGGVWGYARCVEVVEGRLEDPEQLDWLGDWHPEHFDLEAIKKRFDR